MKEPEKPKEIVKIEKLEKLPTVKNYCRRLDRYYDRVRKQKIFDFVTKSLKKGDMVWCRSGNVCDNATPCEQFKCKFKKSKTDIARGCSKCDDFQVTHFSNDWESAYQINMEDFGKVGKA